MRCRNLESVYCKSTTPPILGGEDVFYGNAADRKIYVPYQSLNDYKTAEYWSDYAYAIVGYDFKKNEVVDYGETRLYTTLYIEGDKYEWVCESEEAMNAYQKYINAPRTDTGDVDAEFLANNPLYIDDILVEELLMYQSVDTGMFLLSMNQTYYESQLPSQSYWWIDSVWDNNGKIVITYEKD